MELTETRAALAANVLNIPQCPLPRAGDVVVWYQASVRQRGRLVGSTCEGRPCILPDIGVMNRELNFDSIRIDKLANATGPIWQYMPAGGTLFQPTHHEHESLLQLAQHVSPPGISHRELADEIWKRGFEVFLTGATVRDVLAGTERRDAEVVTTMPLDRLRRIIVDMYGEDQVDAGGPCPGGFRVGGKVGTTDPYAEVRAFRYDKPGTIDGIYGGSFERDVAFGDFALNAIYYDPINNVLVDPSGYGLPDVADCCLRLVLDPTSRSAAEKAEIAMQLIKRCLLGDKPAQGHESSLIALLENLPALPTIQRLATLRAEILDVVPGKSDEILEKIRSLFTQLGREDLWKDNIACCLELL